MNNKLLFYSLLWFTLCVTNPESGGAQTPLTLQECIERGLQYNTYIKKTHEEMILAGASLSELQSQRLPQVSVRVSYFRLSDIDPFTVALPIGAGTVNISPVILNNYGALAQIQQPVYTGNRISNGIESAQLQLDISKLKAERAQQLAVHSITAVYWSLAGAIKKHEVILQSIRQVESHLTDLKNMEEEGLATRSDILRAEARRARVQLEEITAEKSVQLNRTKLNRALGELPALDIIPIDEPEITAFSARLDDCINTALKERAELKMIENSISVNKLQVKIAGSGSLPSVYLQGNFDFSRPNRRILPARDVWEGTWDIGIGLQLNAWDWGKNRSQVEQASARLRSNELEYENLKNTVILEVTEQYLSVTEARGRISTAQSAVGFTVENLRITRSMFQNDMATNTMILDVEQDWLWAQTDLATARMAYRITLAGLLLAMGVDEF